MFGLRLLVFVHLVGIAGAQAIEPLPRRLPPPGIELDDAQRQEVAAARDHIAERLVEIPKSHPRRADVEIFHKAIAYALEFGEFYKPADLKVVRNLVVAADQQVDEIKAGTKPASGLRACGYRSSIDGSVQPYGLEIPEGLDLKKKVPLWVWLHGRGDKVTDLYFIDQRLKKPGQFQPENAIVLHPFGRQCIGWKSAGEIDVLEAIENVAKRYKIDRNRIALMGFSMGGAGAWHIGAHYTDRFAVVHAGAGFAETAEYNRLEPENYPPVYEQTLWRLYDVPHYVRNLFNVNVIAYSGEKDKQIQAARVMERAFAGRGGKLRHLIGPGMGHKYDPESRSEIQAFVELGVRVPRLPGKAVVLQTQTLRYNQMHWITATGLHKHWEDSHIKAVMETEGNLRLDTRNISSFEIDHGAAFKSIIIDGRKFATPDTGSDRHFYMQGDEWRYGERPAGEIRKKPGLQGPIDDVFLEPFLVVLPSKTSANSTVQAWMDFELEHFENRWRATFRGQLRKKRAEELTAEDLKRYHLVAFGEPATNSIIGKAVEAWSDLDWDAKTLSFAGKKLAASSHLPLMIRPNPMNPNNYLVINSGPTFREAHDRTNSLQNPKLPDWALIDLSQPPNAEAAGRVVAADFFDETWKLK